MHTNNGNSLVLPVSAPRRGTRRCGLGACQYRTPDAGEYRTHLRDRHSVPIAVIHGLNI